VFSLCELTNLNVPLIKPNGPFFRAANSIFAKVGRLASEEVIVQSLKQKCMPILLYGLEVCNLDKRSMHSLDFTVNRFFMKLFQTSNMEIVKCCQSLFGCELPSVLLPNVTTNLLTLCQTLVKFYFI